MNFVIQAAIAIGFALLSYLITPKNKNKVDPAEPTSDYSRPIPKVSGTNFLPTNCIYSKGALEQQSSGKGGSSGETEYFCTAAFLLAETLLGVDVVELYANEKKIDLTNPEYSSTVRFYDGTQTTPDPTISANLGSQAVAWHGLAYIMFDRFPTKDLGGNVFPAVRAKLNDKDTTGSESGSLYEVLRWYFLRNGIKFGRDFKSFAANYAYWDTGYILSQSGDSPKDAIDELMPLLARQCALTKSTLWDSTSFNKLMFEVIGRDNKPVTYINDSNYGFSSESSRTEQDNKIIKPNRWTLNYYDVNKTGDKNDITAFTPRGTDEDSSTENVNSNVTTTANSAYSMLINALSFSIVNQFMIELALSPDYLDNLRNSTLIHIQEIPNKYWEVVSISYGANYTLKIKAVYYALTPGDTFPVINPGYTTPPRDNETSSPSQFNSLFSDLPLLDHNYTDRRGYYAVYQVPRDYTNSTISGITTAQIDGGALIDNSQVSYFGTWGEVTDSSNFFTGNPYFVDTRSYLIVDCKFGQFNTISDADFWSKKVNIFVYKDEIISFKVAELIGANLYKLSYFYRNLLHSFADPTKDETITRIIYNNSNLSQISRWENSNLLLGNVVNGGIREIGLNEDYAILSSDTYEGRGAKPLAPINGRHFYDTSQNLTVQWTRVAQLPTDWATPTDQPNIETFLRYRISISGKPDIFVTTEQLNINSSDFVLYLGSSPLISPITLLIRQQGFYFESDPLTYIVN